MVKERCWCCKKMRSDVELCATDDRLCQSCYRKNEENLQVLQRGDAVKDRTSTTTATASRREQAAGATACAADVNKPAESHDHAIEYSDESEAPK
jgi:hypothetical protein